MAVVFQVTPDRRRMVRAIRHMLRPIIWSVWGAGAFVVLLALLLRLAQPEHQVVRIVLPLVVVLAVLAGAIAWALPWATVYQQEELLQHVSTVTVNPDGLRSSSGDRQLRDELVGGVEGGRAGGHVAGPDGAHPPVRPVQGWDRRGAARGVPAVACYPGARPAPATAHRPAPGRAGSTGRGSPGGYARGATSIEKAAAQDEGVGEAPTPSSLLRPQYGRVRSAVRKSFQSSGVKVRVGPFRSLESRTATMLGRLVATSTQSPSPPL